MPRFKWYFIFFSCLLSFNAFSQSNKTLRLDSSSLTIRSFNKEALQQYRTDKDFAYGEDAPDLSPSMWDRFWSWFWDLFRDTVSDSKSGNFFKIFFIILGSLALIFLIVKLIGMDAGNLFTGKSRQINLPYDESLENIHQISFDEEISNALENKDYRLAVRLLYLKSLKKLSDTGRIIWIPNKTNSTYISELKNADLKEKFRLLTYRFEYVWYGSQDIDFTLFDKIDKSFKDFNLIVR